MTRRIFLFLAALVGLTLPAQGLPQVRIKTSPDMHTVVQGNNAFACDLYGQLRRAPGNLFFSPYSISSALAMTYGGARTTTAEQMAKTLHFRLEPQRLHAAQGELYRFLNAPGVKREYKLNIANRLWGQKGYTFNPDFIKLTEEVYGAGLKDVDFQNATDEARRTINAWVEEATQDKIKELLKPGILVKDTRLVLTNAIYFKAAWFSPFFEKDTKDGDFHLVGGGTVKAKLMAKYEKLAYGKEDDMEFAVLPYDRHELSMVVLLPKTADAIADLEKNLTAGNLDKWIKQAKVHEVDLKLPKFKMTSEFKLKPALSALGMSIAFSDRADFSGITTREGLMISEVVHKAFVDVNEKGTEAAAATAVIMAPTAVQILPRATFHVNRPFVFVLRDNQSGSILFLGRVMNPKG